MITAHIECTVFKLSLRLPRDSQCSQYNSQMESVKNTTKHAKYYRNWMAPKSPWKLQMHVLVEQLTSPLSATMHQQRSHETNFTCMSLHM